MVIAIASGKGGTGKTTIATSLAVALVKKGHRVAYLDADVEEPNGHIFLKPRIEQRSDVTVPMPRVDRDKCTLCGECSAVCQSNAMAVLSDQVMVFPSLCNGCGGCYEVCPENAIAEVPRVVGQISGGWGGKVEFFEGRLLVGEAEPPPVIRALRKIEAGGDTTIVDAPPGTSCPVIEAIIDSDFVILVTEPTPFGLNDLKLAVGMVREIGLPHGVVINRSDIGDNRVEKYCRTEGIDVMLQIPFDRQIAEVYARGEMIFNVNTGYTNIFYELYENVADRVNHDGTGGTQR